jgi:D-alanyl-lipoteichoic acid acyltransferase DltB (MBOAT superfamily)
MLFNSFQFLIFFPIVTIAYFTIPHRFRWALVLAASCYFYMAFIPKYILILGITITVDYFAGIGLEALEGRKRKWLLIASLLANIGMLGFFKYFNFANENLAAFADLIGWNYPISSLSIILPIGLSFHTFQSLSYTIEVFRGRQKAERHFGYLAMYVMFYPQLVAGPIERPQNILHQLHTEQKFEYRRVTDGLKWMAWGMFKKVVIADRMALLVDPVYSSPTIYTGPAFAFATLAFAIQIYCDFSGYSDIALGSAQVMGIKLMKNFDHPYFSKSIPEFWRRWHISLSTWFRDYLYLPLGGNRTSTPRWVFNILITFLISGLWHGANWTFVFWGALHGLYVVIFRFTDNFWNQVSASIKMARFRRLTNAISRLFTFLLVTYAWIFFRANNISDAIFISRGLFTGWETYTLQSMTVILEGYKAIQSGGGYQLVNAFFSTLAPLTAEPRSFIAITALSLFILLFVEIKQYQGNFLQEINLQPTPVRLVLYSLLITITLIFGTAYTGTQQPFIYFQF